MRRGKTCRNRKDRLSRSPKRKDPPSGLGQEAMIEPIFNRAGHPMDDLTLVLAVGRMCRQRGRWPTLPSGEPVWRRWYNRLQADPDLALYLVSVRDWDTARTTTRTASETRRAIREWRGKGEAIRAILEAEEPPDLPEEFQRSFE